MNAISPPLPARASLWNRFVAFRQRNLRKEIALLLTGGFLFDVFTLGRIDDWRTLLQQAAYLVVLGLLLAADEKFKTAAKTWPTWRARAWTFNEDLIHFLFGSLLSCYAIFYFKSASGVLSLLFLAALFGLLIANEIPQVRHLGTMIRSGLFSFCLTSFFAYLLPVLTGHISAWQFVLATMISFGIGWRFFALAQRTSGEWLEPLRNVMLPYVAVQGALLGLYFGGVIPPVPLSIKAIGIYHKIEAKGTTWNLIYRPQGLWGFWQRGERVFLARPGDQLYCFTRIFAPHRFKDEVKLRFWRHEGKKRGWVLQDSIPLRISGGREQGFRGYGVKKNYQPGDWKVAVVTLDGRVVGGTRFRIETDTTDELYPLYLSEEAGPTGRRAIPVLDRIQEALPESVATPEPEATATIDPDATPVEASAEETPDEESEKTPRPTVPEAMETEFREESTPAVPIATPEAEPAAPSD